jgi:hypothetical protein
VEDIQERVIRRVRASFGETEMENETDEVQTEMANDTPKVQTNAPSKCHLCNPGQKRHCRSKRQSCSQNSKDQRYHRYTFLLVT